jgi:xanthine dehydrogenase YagT iron-sulfur-binding subunit
MSALAAPQTSRVVWNLLPSARPVVERDGFQCGYCTPGQICSAVGMLAEVKAGWPSHATADVASRRIVLTDAEIVAAVRDVAEGGSK